MNNMLLELPHRRFNPLTHEWILVSPQRTKRPWQGKTASVEAESLPAYDPECYLCPGNKRNNGQENPDYKHVYVFENDFPALLRNTSEAHFKNGLLQAKSERGICKVICFSPDHSLTLPEMHILDIEKVILAWQEEFRNLAHLDFVNNIQIFENKGAIMGCSNPHPHGQIWAQGSIPEEIRKRIEPQKDYYEKHGQSMLSDYLDQEVDLGERIVTDNDDFVALVPFWAVWPFEVMIIPKRHFQCILDLTEYEISSFALILKDVTTRFDNIFNASFPYSAGMIQRPVDGYDHEYWHYHFSFYPPLLRSSSVKKFMVGYEMFANPQRDITPEYAAKVLRELPEVHYKAN